jgi:hypothetical protein
MDLVIGLLMLAVALLFSYCALDAGREKRPGVDRDKSPK